MRRLYTGSEHVQFGHLASRRLCGDDRQVDGIEREDVVTIMLALMRLHEKADRIIERLGGEDGQEAEEIGS
jgi:hypothetical protein